MEKRKPRYILLREAYRNLSQFSSLVEQSSPNSSEGSVHTASGAKQPANKQDSGLKDLIGLGDIEFSFFDLMDALSKVKKVTSEKNRMAFYLNVIKDMKQKDVAKTMGISPVSVGQYVTTVCKELDKIYFGEDD